MHIVLGTAGHVDHGKTALLRALTGVDCDRLAEEKARGITIELGFAPWTIAPKLTASVIDVPGHEKFVGTMVAGASGIDAVLLVVAADDGVMPQTREHLAICTLLGIERGVIVLTKCDLAEDDLLALVEDDIRTLTRGTFLESAEIVRCSALAQTGLEAIATAVQRILPKDPRKKPAPRKPGPAFVAIDRVFSRAGAGTVVTGTLLRGSLAIDDEVEAGGSSLRVRSMEIHGKAASEAHSTTRVALSFRGDGGAVLERGGAVVAKGSALATRAIQATVAFEAGAALKERRTDVKLHLGTTALAASLLVLEDDIALLTTERPFTTFAGQRFVLRRSGKRGNVTIGGGIVRDPNPLPRKRGASFFHRAATPEARVLGLVEDARHRGVAREDVGRRVLWEDDAAHQVSELLAKQAIVEVEGWLFTSTIFEGTKRATLELVRKLHGEHALAAGISGAEIQTQSAVRDRMLVARALAALALEKKLAVSDGLYRATASDAEGERELTLSRIEGCFKNGGFAPPADDVVATEIALPQNAFKDATAELRRRGKLRLIGGFHYEASILASLRTTIETWFQTHDALLPTDLKDLCGGISRRHAIPLLEWLDQERITLRKGDVRVRGSALTAR